MQYVIFIILVFSLQIIFYTNFVQYQNNNEKESERIAKLTRENQVLKIQMAYLQKENVSEPKRALASVNEAVNADSLATAPSVAQSKARVVEINRAQDFSEYYLIQANQLLKQNKKEQALKLFNKIQSQGADEKIVAEALYKKILLTCVSKINDQCLQDTDFMVSHFPQSEWTGKSLVILSDLYKKNNKTQESKFLMEVARREFGSESKPETKPKATSKYETKNESQNVK